MKDIVIYKSEKNGIGGGIDLTNSLDIFDNVDYCCLYIKNESNSEKRILQVNITSLDNIIIGTTEGDTVIDQLYDSTIIDSLVFSDSLSFDTLVLPSGSFFNVWLKKEDTTTYVSNRNLHVSVEYINEY